MHISDIERGTNRGIYNEPLIDNTIGQRRLRLIILFTVNAITISYSSIGIILLYLNYNIIRDCIQSHILTYTTSYICLFIISNICWEGAYLKYTEKYFWIFSIIELSNIACLTWALFELYVIPYNNEETIILDSFNNNTQCLKLENTGSWAYMESSVIFIIVSSIVYVISISIFSYRREVN